MLFQIIRIIVIIPLLFIVWTIEGVLGLSVSVVSIIWWLYSYWVHKADELDLLVMGFLVIVGW